MLNIRTLSLGSYQTNCYIVHKEGINRCPGFAPELQGVYIEQGEDGRKRAYGYVLKNK